ncbi:MAG: PIN domain-containing protein [Myxococcales bacterium]
MIYLDTSVALAQLLGEDRRPPDDFWKQRRASSRLLIYEMWNRLHARGLGDSHAGLCEELLAETAFVEFRTEVLARALEPFPTPVRTLDALHLSSADFLRSRGDKVSFATYDERMARAAKALGFPIAEAG